MGLNNWWDRAQQANDFLETGIFNEVAQDPFEAGKRGRKNKCSTTSDCASGYACVDGTCMLMGQGGSSGGGIAASPGSWIPGSSGVYIPGTAPCQGSGSAPGAGGCNDGGPGGCQSQANCGNGADIRECCGTRTCSFSAFGVVCVCNGDIEFLAPCVEFCDSFSQANGILGAGCTENQSCSDCAECWNGFCTPVGPSFRPCWCDGGESCNEAGCQHCVTDPDDDDFGDCRHKNEGCQDCTTLFNFVCPCGIRFKGPVVLDPVTACKPSGSGGPHSVNLAQFKAVELCEAICRGKDPVAGCNCDADCADCEYCTDDAQCEPDPACDEEEESEEEQP